MPQPHSESRSRPIPGAALVTLDGRAYPLESARITAHAEGGLAHSTLTQDFSNPYEEPLEVLYTLPLPADGVVVGYTVRIGERVIRGEIEKREYASESYARAIAEGRAASLLEQDRDDTFTQRLGSLPPRQSVQVETQVLHPLGFVPSSDLGPARWEYRFPTVAGIRYQGEPGRVTDAKRLDVDRVAEGEIPARVELDLTVADGPPEGLGVASTTHDIRCAAEVGATRVGLRAGARLDRDLVLRWRAASERDGVRLVEGSGLEGDGGRYALLTLTPPALPAAVLARDVTVLIDASGSMSGEPLELAKEVIGGLIQSLDAGDRLELIAFASAPQRLTRGLMEASAENLRKIKRSLAGVVASGGTEMQQAVVEALTPLREDSQRQVVLVTDGQIGFESRVVGELLRRLPANARVHTVGVGAAPNRALTRAVARAGRGVEVFAHDPESAIEAARRLVRATARPVLTELSVGGDAVIALAPRRPCDVLAGQPLVLALELQRAGGMVELSGRQAGTAETWMWRIALPGTVAGSPAAPGAVLSTTPLPLGALYGREVIADLELEVAARDDADTDLDARIERAGLRHRITSRMTSLVAIAEEPSVDPKLARRRERLAVEVPQGMSADGAGLNLVGTSWLVAKMGRRFAMGAMAPGRIGRPALLRSSRGAQPIGPMADGGAQRPVAEAPEVRITEARVLSVAADRLTIEFETPFDGFVLPDSEVNLWLEGATWRIARVLPEESTPRGPHRAGLVVRLSLAIHPEWARATSVELRWSSTPEGSPSDTGRRQISLSVALAEKLTEPR